LLSNTLEIIGVDVLESKSNTTKTLLSNFRGEDFVKDVVCVILVHWNLAAIFFKVTSAVIHDLFGSTLDIDSVGIINFGVLNYSQLSPVFRSKRNFKDHVIRAASDVVVNWELSILEES